MKTTSTNRLVSVFSLFLAAITADLALAQSRFAPYSGTVEKSGASEGSGQTSAVVVSGPNLRVSKTASAIGHEVCGVIRISNTGVLPATVTAIADSLEVHFPRGATPAAPPPAGSTPGWFKVADVLIPLPGPIAPRATTSIDYCFPICSAADAPGANSMRNVVAVTVTDPGGTVRTFTTRSASFTPPVLDCQACCLPNGDCSDAVPEACTADGGESQGPGTDCTSTQCCEPLGDGCFSAVDCCDATARCIEDACCLELAETGCTERSHCCEENGTVALCDEGKCCAPNRAPDSCHDTRDCCDENAICSSGTCCIELGATGCTNLVGNDCCQSFGAVTCEEGKCCAPTGADNSCTVDSDCCDPSATCNGGTCCVRLTDAGCEESSDCCEGDGIVICDAGRCCAPNRAPDSCHDAGDCCDGNAICSAGTCCIALGATGCTDVVGNDCCPSPFGAVVCEEGKCCAPTGVSDSCNVDSDCCDSDATCNNGTCCVRFAEAGCEDVSDCCDVDGIAICDNGRCCAPSRAPDSCDLAGDCCDPNATCQSGTCCIALGATGCTNLVGNDCCASAFGAVICEGGRCCAPTGVDNSCTIDADCCDPNTRCNGGTCCIATSGTGCTDFDDCCSSPCVEGVCCNSPGFSCSFDTDCCAGLSCSGGDCCIPAGSACTFSSACCGTVCTGGTCCNPPGLSCASEFDCCGNSICQSGACCVQQFQSCSQDSDCCSGLVCNGGICEGVFGP